VVRLPEIRQEVTDARIGLLWVVGENVMRRLRDSLQSGKAVGNRLYDLVWLAHRDKRVVFAEQNKGRASHRT
jgi:hypothetical protein